MEEEKIFYILNYTHNELLYLLKKIEDNCVLTPEQYDQLIEEIGLNNISTFTGDYDDLFNKPVIPVRISELYNDVGFDTIKNVDYKISNALSAIEKSMEECTSMVDALNKLDLEMVSEDLVYLQSRLEFLEKMIEELRRYNNSFSSQLDNTRSQIIEIESDLNTLEYNQDDLREDLDTTRASINAINETKLELMDLTKYLKETIVGENEYEFDKSVVQILKDIRGEDFSDETTMNLVGITTILDILMGLGDGENEETLGVLKRKDKNGLIETICVRDYIYKIDSIYEQLGKDGLISFINTFKESLELLQKENEDLKLENESLKESVTKLEQLHIEEVVVLRNTLESQAADIKRLEEAIKNNAIDGVKALLNNTIAKVEDTWALANSNRNGLNTLNNALTDNIISIDARLDVLEDQPEHVYVTETEYYRDYTEEERNSPDTLFIVTDFTDQDLDWNIERFLTKDLVANNSITEFVTQAQYDALMNSQQINNNVIYVITDNTKNPVDTYTSIDTSSVQLAMKNSITEVENTSIFVDVDNQLKFKDCDGRIFAINLTEEK